MALTPAPRTLVQDRLLPPAAAGAAGLRIASAGAATLAPTNGRWPATISYSITPSAHTSSGAPAGRPPSASGDMYATVPRPAAAPSAERRQPEVGSVAIPRAVSPMLLV